MKVYSNFNEVESDIERSVPSVIYKYRSWDDEYHRKIIIDQEVWFAHPYSLNDPYDIRPPYRFIVENADWDQMRVKLIEAGKIVEPNLTIDELNREVEQKLAEMKVDPIKYFKNSHAFFLSNSNRYDNAGVFSCCSTFSNDAMWAHYGNNHSGFAVGFNTLELVKSLRCAFGVVNYNDEPIDYHVLGNNENLMNEEIFRKSTKWSYEEELRFVTFGIGIIRSRNCVFPANAVQEIVIGISTSDEVQSEITKYAKEYLPDASIYKLEIRYDTFGYNKIRIH